MKKLIIITLILLPVTIFGQPDSCIQFEKSVNYLKTDSTFQSYFEKTKMRFDVNENVGSGGVYPVLTEAYIVRRLGYDDKSMYYRLDSSVVYPMSRKLAKEELYDTTNYHLPCLSSLGVKRNAKIAIDFYRKDQDALVVYSKKIYRKQRHTMGMAHLFFFDNENNILKVFVTSWIE